MNLVIFLYKQVVFHFHVSDQSVSCKYFGSLSHVEVSLRCGRLRYTFKHGQTKYLTSSDPFPSEPETLASCPPQSDLGSVQCLKTVAQTPRHDIKLNTHAWGILLGHVTGFAAVNAWSSLQQVVPSFLSFLVPIVAFASISGIYKATARWRYEKTMADGEEDEFEVIWGEHVAETEDEVISLSVSFLTVQLLRFCITGQLPEASGEDSENSPPHSLWSCTLLLLVGVILGLAEMGRLLLARRAGTGAFARAVSVESSAEGAERGAAMRAAEEKGRRSAKGRVRLGGELSLGALCGG